jgi:predicted enzyme related to lactoylglutathione lyase
MSIRIGNVTIDTNDLPRATAFWQAVMGYEVTSSGEDNAYLSDPKKRGPALYLQVVPEPRVGKNRLHLDLAADDLEGEAARIRSLGATEVRRFGGEGGGWIVMTDTDGNQFCITPG